MVFCFSSCSWWPWTGRVGHRLSIWWASDVFRQECRNCWTVKMHLRWNQELLLFKKKILSSSSMQPCITCTCCSPMLHQITGDVLIMHSGECVGFLEALPASLNLAVSLRAGGISPDPSADTSSVLFTHSFLLLHARICFILFFFWSFLNLAILPGLKMLLFSRKSQPIPHYWWRMWCTKCMAKVFFFLLFLAFFTLIAYEISAFLAGSSNFVAFPLWPALSVHVCCISSAESSCNTSSKFWYVQRYIFNFYLLPWHAAILMLASPESWQSKNIGLVLQVVQFFAACGSAL